MKTVEKDFDLIKALDDTAKHIDLDMIALNAKKEALNEVITYIKSNNLKITKTEQVEEENKKD